MDWLLFTKYLHVVFAIIWLGAGLCMVYLGIKADRSKNDAELVGVVLQVAWLGSHLYVPAGIVTFIFGAIAAWLGAYYWHLWIVLGLVGFVITFGLGGAVLKPRADKVQTDHKAGVATPEMARQAREILQIAKFDMVLLFTIVADMVYKPVIQDVWVLVIMAVAILAAGIVFLMPVLGKKGATS